MSTYGGIEGFIATQLAAGTQENPSPFKAARVLLEGSSMSDPEIADELVRLDAPGCMVFYAGGEGNDNIGQVCDETAYFHVVVKSMGRTRREAAAGSTAQVGLYDLAEQIKTRLNNQRGTNCPNPLVWARSERLRLADQGVNVGALVMVFKTIVSTEIN